VEERMSENNEISSENLPTKSSDILSYYNKETGEELEKIIAKMSKSLKNVINPDNIIKEH
jgi:leucyl-tRNA synthetase